MAATESDARLRDRIRDLEAELSEARRERGTEDTFSDFSDLSGRKMDEASRLFRGLFRATLESVRVASDATSTFVDEVLTRNRPERDESPTDAVRRLPADVKRGLIRALDDSLDVPNRAVDAFSKTFRDTRERGRSQTRAKPSASRSSETRREAPEPAEDRYEDWSKSDLYERAQQLDLEGRSTMTREELIAAIRSHESGRP